MNNTTVKIYNQIEFQQLVKNVKGLKIAQSVDTDLSQSQLVDNLDNLVVSDSLCCSFCNTKFENKIEQRSHYKLEWHRFNLKQNLNGFESVSENKFESLTDKSLLYTSGFDTDSENESVENVLDDSFESSVKVDDSRKTISSSSKHSNSNEDNIKLLQNKNFVNSYHTKVFFENDDGSTFSIYRCLLHNKKRPPESDHILVRQALECAKKSLWTIILLGGGHFAAAIFSDGKPLVHKTFHCYTIRSKQGSMQSTIDNKGSRHPKSAGASLRRYNEASLAEHVQTILESWSSYISDCSLILYRAIGPYNRNILFGGKNTLFDKNDNRLRPLPFPTQKPTFSEVQRVYDVLSSVEVCGFQISSDKFDTSFSNQACTDLNLEQGKNANDKNNSFSEQIVENCKVNDELRKNPNTNKVNKKLRNSIDRAKSRKSPDRPLPDIVAKLAESSESEFEFEDSAIGGENNFEILEHELQINFKDDLQTFENFPPRRTKKTSQKNKTKKN